MKKDKRKTEKIEKKKTHSVKMTRKRQIGTEKHTTPLSHLHEKPSSGKIAMSRLSIVLTVFFWFIYIISVIVRQLIEGPQSYQFTIELVGYVIVVTFLTFSALMYLVARQGAFQRFSKHVRVPRAVLEKYFHKHQPSITVLVPSYDEEPGVIRKTLMSAALQEYPNVRVVLLLDDDVSRIQPETDRMQRFEATKALGQEIKTLLASPYNRFSQALDRFEQDIAGKEIMPSQQVLAIADQYKWASQWLNELADKEEVEDHVDIFFTEHVLRELATDLNLVSEALVTSNKEGAKLTAKMGKQLYFRLVSTFKADLDVFERKRYASLSHELNKAMNINAYIGLMGKTYRQEQTPDGTVLIPVTTPGAGEADLTIPDSEFILTLDADSILLQEYCLRLVYFLQQPDNANVAVAQTPYSSFRGTPTRVERLAGATTDVQHILHQGMTYYNATFWVGANAVIRKRALEDIVEKEWIGGYEVKRYVQDRTVIEDTESSIDLAIHGWRLVNYPERLSYSATPPDFGALVVQRRRWANGGLLIMPKLLTQLGEYKRKGKNVSKTEFLLRLNYMASIAWSNLGLVFLLAYPYDGRLLSPLVLLAAMPYFLAMASDLKYCRYNYTDVIRIYGFNLILLPVNIAGVLKSLEQALTTKKIPFARTPKVKDRTGVELPFLIAPLLIVGFSLFTMWRNIGGQNWGNAVFAGFNAIASIYAIISYIGLWNLFVDIWLGVTNLLYVDAPAKKPQKDSTAEPTFDWKGVLYHGDASGTVPHGAIDTSTSSNPSNKRGAIL